MKISIWTIWEELMTKNPTSAQSQAALQHFPGHPDSRPIFYLTLVIGLFSVINVTRHSPEMLIWKGTSWLIMRVRGRQVSWWIVTSVMEPLQTNTLWRSTWTKSILSNSTPVKSVVSTSTSTTNFCHTWRSTQERNHGVVTNAQNLSSTKCSWKDTWESIAVTLVLSAMWRLSAGLTWSYTRQQNIQRHRQRRWSVRSVRGSSKRGTCWECMLPSTKRLGRSSSARLHSVRDTSTSSAIWSSTFDLTTRAGGTEITRLFMTLTSKMAFRKHFCSEPGCEAKFFTRQKLLQHLADGNCGKPKVLNTNPP